MVHDQSLPLRQALDRFVAGEVECYTVLSAAADADIRQAVALSPVEYSLNRRATALVLQKLIGHDVDTTLVQRWGALMRWGVLGGRQGGPIAIDIRYEAPIEDLLIEVVARLDDIGDAVDGVVTVEEAQEFLRLLSE